MFLTVGPFHPSLMFESKAGAYPSKEPFRCSPLVFVPISPLNSNETLLERPARDKQSILF